MHPTRRSFIRGIIAAALAPAIIRTPGLLMPVKPGLGITSGLAPLPPGNYTGQIINASLNVGDVITFQGDLDKMGIYPLRKFIVSFRAGFTCGLESI